MRVCGPSKANSSELREEPALLTRSVLTCPLLPLPLVPFGAPRMSLSSWFRTFASWPAPCCGGSMAPGSRTADIRKRGGTQEEQVCESASPQRPARLAGGGKLSMRALLAPCEARGSGGLTLAAHARIALLRGLPTRKVQVQVHALPSDQQGRAGRRSSGLS